MNEVERMQVQVTAAADQIAAMLNDHAGRCNGRCCKVKCCCDANLQVAAVLTAVCGVRTAADWIQVQHLAGQYLERWGGK